MTVLLIDDDLQFRGLLALLLEHEGFDVRLASNGREGLGRLESEPTDAVVLDLRMPGMSGERFLAAKNGNPTIADVPTIVVSGQAATAHLPSRGLVAVMRKPVDTELLVSRLWAITT